MLCFRVIPILMLAIGSPPESFARRKEGPAFQGRVTLADGSAPQLIVTIERVCKGITANTYFADSRGSFGFDESNNEGCEVRAYLPGYRSQSLPVKSGIETLVLKKVAASDLAAQRAERNGAVAKLNKTAWRAYEKGLDAARKADWRSADENFSDVTTLTPWFASGWLCLGIIQEKESSPAAAKKSYRQAIKNEDNFLLPYIYAAALEVARGDWQEALDDSNKVIQNDAAGFPSAWLSNAWANLNKHQMDQAEKSALEGQKLDGGEHRFPEFDYLLGLISVDKRDAGGVAEHFKNYLTYDPHGPHADAARAQLNRR